MLLQLLLFQLLICPATAALASSAAKPGCQEKCGNITIPYPFGFGDPSCFLNEHFNVTCLDIHPSRPFIDGRSFEVLEILLDEGQVRVDGWMAYDCYSNSTSPLIGRNVSSNIIGTPYTFSYKRNRFTAVGCDTFAFLRGSKEDEFTTGCVSTCSENADFVEGACSGIGCCQTDIPKGLQRVEIVLGTLNNRNTTRYFSPCSYAFLADEEHFNFPLSLLRRQNVSFDLRRSFPRVLDWVIGSVTCEEAQRNSSSYACGRRSTCVNSTNSPGYRCRCASGYQGNPYLPDGCQDVDECAFDPNPCTKGICNNEVGNYYCSCPVGTHGYYGNNGDGCISDLPDKPFPTVQVVLGVCLSVLFALASSSWLYWGLRKRQAHKLKEKFFQRNGGLLLQQRISATQSSAETARIFTAEELKRATKNYDESQIIGRGGYGTVYKGILPDKRIVAIKKSKVAHGIQIDQFINEISLLLHINHRNVVKLLGCCLETEVPILVYEFVSNGTLFHHLHDESSISFISWENRLRIAAETAGALAYLHSATSSPIIHRDVKSANILLDSNYRAKVADFGASKLVPLDYTQITTLVQGTLGYLDPEYFQTGKLTEKSDVYSFGVVLAELLTGKKPVSERISEKDRNLSWNFIMSMKENHLFQVLDRRVLNDGRIDQLCAVAELAKRCLRLRGEKRPTMKEVAMELEGLRRLETHSSTQEDDEEFEYLFEESSRGFISHGDGKESLVDTDTLDLEENDSSDHNRD